jgi:hypothetical protein
VVVAARDRVYLYLGTPTGLAPAPHWPVNVPGLFGNPSAHVASAGDVNGDGYDDVVVGEPWYDDPGYTNEGQALLFLGSPNGLTSTPSWTADPTDQPGAEFGADVLGGGDVNNAKGSPLPNDSVVR